MVKPGQLAAAAGVGLAAGLAGTAAMTLSSTIEMKVRGRPASQAPAQAAGKVLGVKPTGGEQAKRFGTMVHWAYGTGWGAIRGVLATLGMPAPAATVTHLALLWGAEQLTLPALGAAPPLTQQAPKEAAISAWHDLVYAGTTGAAYQLLDRTR
jgi:hypothetical protein